MVSKYLKWLREKKEQLNPSPEGEIIKNIIVEIILKITDYVKDTGNILDIFGKNNFTFFQKDNGEWDYKVLDPFYPDFLERSKVNFQSDDENYSEGRINYAFY